jgi:transketolase N-terminal domain/subunit
MPFEVDLSAFKPMKLDPARPVLSAHERQQLQANIQLCRDAIVYFTAVADAKGLGGHTGGAYDTVPEVLIAQAFCANNPGFGIPTMYDEAGHRVATQYLLSVLNGDMPAEKLLHYREFNQQLPGHPERGLTPGVAFSSGRLGHMWSFVNGVAIANPGKVVFMLGSDGSQMEGDDAEAARLCVGQKLSVKVIVDDNDVTIAGFPSKYMPGYDVARTLEGHGLSVIRVGGEDLDALYAAMCRACTTDGPVAIVLRGDRRGAADLESLPVLTPGGTAVPLAQLARIELGFVEPVLKRLDRQPVLRVQADPVGGEAHGLRNNHSISGTPMRAVSTPTGSSRGSITVRASASASTSRLPPASAAPGSRAR